MPEKLSEIDSGRRHLLRLPKLLVEAGFAAEVMTLATGVSGAVQLFFERTALADDYWSNRLKARGTNPSPENFAWVSKIYPIAACDSKFGGEGLDLSQLPREIEYIVFYFSATWCAGCNALIEANQNNHKPKNVFFCSCLFSKYGDVMRPNR